MFNQSKISAVDFADVAATKRSHNSTRAASRSCKRASSASLRDETASPPNTTDTESINLDSSASSRSTDAWESPQKRKTASLRHYSGNRSHQTSPTLTNNYSWPRKSCDTHSTAASPPPRSQLSHHSSLPTQSRKRQLQPRLDVSTESAMTEPRSCQRPDSSTPVKTKPANWSPLPVAVLDKYQPRPIHTTTDRQAQCVNVSNANHSVQKLQDNGRQRRHTSARTDHLALADRVRHTPLEPWVAQHRRKEADDGIDTSNVKQKTKAVSEAGTSCMSRKFWNSQMSGPVSSSKMPCRAHSLKLPTRSLDDPPESPLQNPINDMIDVVPIGRPRLSERLSTSNLNHKRTTNPKKPQHKRSATTDGDFTLVGSVNGSRYDEKSEARRASRLRPSRSLSLSQVARAGSFYLGRLAPPKLSHEASTPGSRSVANNLGNQLQQSTPRLEPLQAPTQGKSIDTKASRNKLKKSFPKPSGTADASACKQVAKVANPACTQEVTTLGGVKHLQIIVPTDVLPFVLPPSGRRRRSPQISIAFTEEMLNPLAGPRIERMLTSVDPLYHRLSGSGMAKWRAPKTAPKLLEPIPVNKHPLASREDQTRARKLQDLHRMKKKPSSEHAPVCKHAPTKSDASDKPLPPLPAVSGPIQSSSPQSLQVTGIMADEGDCENKVLPNEQGQAESRMVVLEKQNARLTQALANVMGLTLQEGDLACEEVLTVFMQASHSMKPIRE